ncbi:MAG: hypothetical protein JW818_00310 [Pirellulales bacterium]|nr:hypothetical protein [Pirellulales bacterium]
MPVMPAAHPFRHQNYSTAPPAAPHHTLTPGTFPPLGSELFKQRMNEVGRALEAAGVAAVYLVHGTFVGSDALGVLTELARVLPRAGKAARRRIKRIVDKVTGEVGNYTGQYAQQFEESINASTSARIPVRRFCWSSENHHLGRADGAVRLIDELVSRKVPVGKRILLWGHSHAGNVFALATNLLSGNREAIDQFFDAGRIYYRWPLVPCVDIPVWKRVRHVLARETSPLQGVGLDMVTFGTPIRYGWDRSGFGQLLHFINHRPNKGMPDYRAPFPPKLTDLMTAAGGDYVQQLGIAGTNIMPNPLCWRTWLADRRLDTLLQQDLAGQKLRDRFATGAIVPDEGTSLLVDYGPLPGGVDRHLAGHAVYTSSDWLLFHAEEVAHRLYASPESNG